MQFYFIFTWYCVQFIYCWKFAPLACCTMINVLIVDDEKRACANLKNKLAGFADIRVLDMALNTAEAEILIRSLKPDAVFLDIQMPRENAFQFLDRIGTVDFEIIFVTAYDDYAVRAFKLNALDYILKPIDAGELSVAVHKLRERIGMNNLIRTYETSFTELSDSMLNNTRQTKVVLRSTNHSEIVAFKDIYFIEAQGSYSRILFLQNEVVREMTMSVSLSDYEEMLPSDLFYRIHKSYLINCSHVNRILTGETNYVVVKHEYTLPVSRRRFFPLKKILKNYGY